MSKPTYAELREALREALQHLDYCGRGGSWERECSEELRKRLPATLNAAEEEEPDTKVSG